MFPQPLQNHLLSQYWDGQLWESVNNGLDYWTSWITGLDLTYDINCSLSPRPGQLFTSLLYIAIDLGVEKASHVQQNENLACSQVGARD